MKIKLNNEWLEVTNINNYGYLPTLELEDNTEWYVAESSEHAGEKTKEYWQEMINNDPVEFRLIVGDNALIAWAFGENHAVGSVGCSSLNEWLDLTTEYPEEQWASYDGEEIELSSNDSDNELQLELDFIPTVAYRWN